MNIVLRHSVILTALFALCVPTMHASAAEPLHLTLPQAVALALARNPDVQLARNQKTSTSIGIVKAQGGFLPSLQLSGSAAHQRYLRDSVARNTDVTRSANLQASADLNLFNGFADVSSLKSSKLQFGAADDSLLRQQQTVAFDTASQFVSILTDRELVQVARENLTSQQDLLKQIEAFYHAGSKPITDLYQQQAAAAQSQLDLLSAQRNLDVARLQLLQLLGQVPPTEVDVVAPDTRQLGTEVDGLDLNRSFQEALKRRPDLLAQDKQVMAAQTAVRQARAGYLPTLDLVATAGSGYSSAVSDRNFNQQFGHDNLDATIGLSLTVPIFDRDLTRTNVAQARVGVENASVTLTKLQQQAGVEVGQALADYRNAREQLKVAEAKLTYARQAWQATRARYRVGASTWIDLSAANATYIQARNAEVQARYAVLLQGLAVGYYRGDLGKMLALLGQQENPS